MKGSWIAAEGEGIQEKLGAIVRSLNSWSFVSFGDLKKKIEKVEKVFMLRRWKRSVLLVVRGVLPWRVSLILCTRKMRSFGI